MQVVSALALVCLTVEARVRTRALDLAPSAIVTCPADLASLLLDDADGQNFCLWHDRSLL